MELHLWNHRNGKMVLCFIEYPYKLQQKVSYYGLKKKRTVDQFIKKKKGELEVNEAEKTWTLNNFVSVSKWNTDSNQNFKYINLKNKMYKKPRLNMF